MDFETLYRAVESRDERFDGRVFVGVKSTGIYCRPICPVPMPRRDRVQFFGAAEAAEERGFRACRRCRPEASPDSPDWDIRADLVGRGLRLIAEGVVDSEGVAGLAGRLAVGGRHLHRAFVQEVGTGPLAVARSRRARLAKQLLEQTDLPGASIAFAAGFSSIRAYNDTIRQLYGRSPTEIRSHRLREDRGEGVLTLRLSYRPPLAAEPLQRFLAERAIPGVEAFDGLTFRRAMRTPGGRPVVVGLRFHPTRSFATLDVVVDEVPDLTGVVQTARRLLDLDSDPSSIDGALSADPALRPLVRSVPGIRLPGAVDGFELAVRAIVGQQVSVRAARTLAGRIVAAAGTRIHRSSGDDAITHLFPTPEQLAETSLTSIGLTPARAATICRLAEQVATDKLDLSGAADPGSTLETLLAIPGIGPWTGAYVAMRALRDPDAFPASDLGVRVGFERLDLPSTPAAIRERAERWHPWRAYAVMHLWNAER
ncbi:MAG: DNA-3-methyladenine glycosylase 2 family protein [Actinomycetota bacterium]